MYDAKNANIANNTVNIIKRGYYLSNHKNIMISDGIKKSYDGTTLYFNENDNFMDTFQNNALNFHDTKISFTLETTMKASDRLSYVDGKVGILNFASATKPGGGFLNGAAAQEESIARISSLYNSLSKFNGDFYITHIKAKDPYYSNRIIYSPEVVVFKDENGEFLSEPYCVDVVTSPAVNKRRAIEMRCCNNAKAYKVMENRIREILAVFAMNKNDILVLGAFGCGVFGNSPDEIAGIFAKILCEENYKRFFKEIVFAIYDKRGTKAVNEFKDAFYRKIPNCIWGMKTT